VGRGKLGKTGKKWGERKHLILSNKKVNTTSRTEGRNTEKLRVLLDYFLI
jgi:hypothetical protein